MTKTQLQSIYDIIYNSLEESGIEVKDGSNENEIIIQDEISLQFHLLNHDDTSCN